MTETLRREETKAGRRICVGKHDYFLTLVYKYNAQMVDVGPLRYYKFQCRNCGNQRLISRVAFWR